jgi:hypothetical protein
LLPRAEGILAIAAPIGYIIMFGSSDHDRLTRAAHGVYSK